MRVWTLKALGHICGHKRHQSYINGGNCHNNGGNTSNIRGDLEQVKYAEQLGIGNVTISERADFKEIGAL